MEDQARLRQLSQKLTDIRVSILQDYPFFGRLLLRLPTRFAPCGTAYTDMQCIGFDPEFAGRLSDPELRFVYLHEVMHCVLNHCIRAKGKDRYLYNIACDIVINSMLLDMMYLPEFNIDNAPVMHLTPAGVEGREFTADQVYEQLRRQPKSFLQQKYGANGMDNHSIWRKLKESSAAVDQWGKILREAAKCSGTGTGIPAGMRRYLDDMIHNPTTNWRQLLHDYLRFDRSDYSFSQPDRRFSGDLILPSFQQDMYGARLENIWLFVDTSGSVSSKGLTAAFCEIKAATEQLDSISGKLSFFDTQVSKPKTFESVEDLMKIDPVGGGGTSFKAVFRYLQDHARDDPPVLVIIMTDGYAEFPSVEDTMGVDVLWTIIASDVEPPWGECIHVDL